jgi:SWI/SNF related-matrix-associated actin-dependent regulator of chromatin subfamily C
MVDYIVSKMVKTRKKNGYPSESEDRNINAVSVFSFSKICRALCDSYPGLAPYITEPYLAKLTHNFQYFMEEQLGRDATAPRKQVKLPASTFSDYSESGALCLLLETLIQSVKPDEGSSSRFRDKSQSMRQENLVIYDKVKAVLEKNGYIKKRKLFFGSSVPDNILPELEKIVSKHDALVVTSQQDATHIVEWDSGVDGDALPETLIEEYVRTVEIRRSVNAPAAAAPAVIAPATGPDVDPFREGTALVHWWYHPDSYDECIPATDVDNTEMPTNFPDDMVGENWKNSVWHVCCRYVRDVQLFNEWGNELDYELDLDKETNVGGDASAKSSAARGRGRQGRNKRKLVPASEEKPAPAKKKVELYSSVLEASAATEKTMSHLAPPSVRGSDQGAADNKFSVLEVELSSNAEPSNEFEGNIDQTSSCKLAVDVKSSVWGPTPTSVEGGMEIDMEPEQKRRRLGPNRHSASRDPLSNGSSGSAPTKGCGKVPAAAPSWFQADSVSSTEVRYLADFFDGSSKARNFETYMSMRSFMTNLYAQNTSTYLSATDCRKKLCGDAAAVIRIHCFLDTFGVINYAVPAEARPPTYPLATITPLHAAGSFRRPQSDSDGATVLTSRKSDGRRQWTREDDVALMKCVLDHGSDWHATGAAMGARRNGAGLSVEDCVVRFAEMPVLKSSGSAAEGITSATEMDIVGSEDTDSVSVPSRGMLQELLNEYVAARLAALEEKVSMNIYIDVLFFSSYFDHFISL